MTFYFGLVWAAVSLLSAYHDFAAPAALCGLIGGLCVGVGTVEHFESMPAED